MTGASVVNSTLFSATAAGASVIITGAVVVVSVLISTTTVAGRVNLILPTATLCPSIFLSRILYPYLLSVSISFRASSTSAIGRASSGNTTLGVVVPSTSTTIVFSAVSVVVASSTVSSTAITIFSSIGF